MEFKKVVKCIDESYVEGTVADLTRMARQYTDDFSKEALQDILEFCQALKAEREIKLMSWLIESIEEKENNRLDLGQVKTDLYENGKPEAIELPEANATCVIWREHDIVTIAISGIDDAGPWTAASTYSLEQFLELETGSLDTVIGAIMYYNTQHEDAGADIISEMLSE